ncbi:hypothetical protein BN2127_JRS4_01307 [Bacillus cereus]|nr:hypothetical protein BN2127_JRS4_01307 [Bacillus cereus]
MDRKLGMFLNTKHIEVNEGIKKAREWGVRIYSIICYEFDFQLS